MPDGHGQSFGSWPWQKNFCDTQSPDTQIGDQTINIPLICPGLQGRGIVYDFRVNQRKKKITMEV